MNQSTQSVVPDPYGVPALLLRLMLGVLLLFAGLNKFLAGYGAVTSSMVRQFLEETWLPAVLLYPYVYVLPFVEVALGLLLMVGLLSRPMLLVAGLLLISLAFGKMLTRDHVTVANNANYVLLAAAAYCFTRENPYSLDAVLKRILPR